MKIMSNTRVNPDIAHARFQATFDPLRLTHFLDHGSENSKRKRFLQNIAIKELVNGKFKRYSELSREELYEQALRKTVLYYKKCQDLNLTTPMEKFWFGEVFFPSEMSPFDLHAEMFLPTIHKLGTKEQKEKWLPLAETYQMLGTYAQTELGHGTFLRGLETVATYDMTSKEFIIDSPTITSTKFWAGALGKTTNVCIVMAKLFIDGRDRGMQSFLVQTRDFETHLPLPGISIGDIGTKFGFGEMDNGYLRLNKVRIPRGNMLMRYAQVLEDGSFVQPKNVQLVYGTMTLVRAQISQHVARILAKIVTIATRYSAVRIQSEINPGAGEVPVLAFQTQQHKMIVQIATAYALTFIGRRSINLYERVSSQIETGDLQQMPLLHAISSGLKAFNSWAMVHGVEQCRFACGGHGYLQASGIPRVYANEAPACTYEGENTVLALQTARFLNKCLEGAQRGQELPPSIRFLVSTATRSQLTEDLEPDAFITAYEHRAAVYVKQSVNLDFRVLWSMYYMKDHSSRNRFYIYEFTPQDTLLQGANKRMRELMESGMKTAEAWNHSSQAFVEAAMAFCHAYIVRSFVETIQEADLAPSLARVMTQLCQFYAAHGIVENAGHFVKDGFMSGAQLDMVQSKVYDLLHDLKPNAVALVDAFDFPDEVLDSDLGRYDGNVYEALMDSARKSKLNENEVHEGIFKYVKPYVQHLKKQKELQARL